MEGHIVAHDLGVADLVDRHPHHLAPGLEIEHLLVFGGLFGGAVQHSEQLFLLDRLHQIVEGGHLVAFCNVIAVAGDENDLDQVVFGPQPPGHGHTVHRPHLHIQQQDIVIVLFGVGEQKLLRRIKGRQLHRMAGGCRPLFRQARQIGPVRRRIVAQRDLQIHIPSPCSFSV